MLGTNVVAYMIQFIVGLSHNVYEKAEILSRHNNIIQNVTSDEVRST